MFIAGKLPLDRRRKLPWEHIAMAAESRTIHKPADLLTLPVYGIPESFDRTAGPLVTNLFLASGEYWRTRFRQALKTTIGSPTTVWNFISREDSVTEREAKHFGFLLSVIEGTMRFRPRGQFVVDPTLKANVQTNCLGFVCSLFEYFGLRVIAHDCPLYDSQYSYDPGKRDFPSPGHMAHALNIGKAAHPYRPSDSSEAKKYARVDTTLKEVTPR